MLKSSRAALSLKKNVATSQFMKGIACTMHIIKRNAHFADVLGSEVIMPRTAEGPASRHVEMSERSRLLEFFLPSCAAHAPP